MNALFKKLNYKEQKSLVILHAPKSFDENLESFQPEVSIYRSLKDVKEIEFLMAFSTKQTEVDKLVTEIAPLLKGDAVFWMCYPKGTSKEYKCDFNRDTGWTIMGKYDMEPVRSVSVDDDWTALRFRKADYIKTMKRKSLKALSDKGKIKSAQI